MIYKDTSNCYNMLGYPSSREICFPTLFLFFGPIERSVNWAALMATSSPLKRCFIIRDYTPPFLINIEQGKNRPKKLGESFSLTSLFLFWTLLIANPIVTSWKDQVSIAHFYFLLLLGICLLSLTTLVVSFQPLTR